MFKLIVEDDGDIIVQEVSAPDLFESNALYFDTCKELEYQLADYGLDDEQIVEIIERGIDA